MSFGFIEGIEQRPFLFALLICSFTVIGSLSGFVFHLWNEVAKMREIHERVMVRMSRRMDHHERVMVRMSRQMDVLEARLLRINNSTNRIYRSP